MHLKHTWRIAKDGDTRRCAKCGTQQMRNNGRWVTFVIVGHTETVKSIREAVARVKAAGIAFSDSFVKPELPKSIPETYPYPTNFYSTEE